MNLNMNKIAYLLLLFCVACGNAKQKAPKEIVPKHKSSPLAKLSGLTIEDSVLLKAFYGVVQRDSRTPTPEYFSGLDLPLKKIGLRPETDTMLMELGAETISFRIVDKVYFGEDNKYCACFTTSDIPDNDCHSCIGILGIFVLKKNAENKWDYISHSYDASLQGSYGLAIASTVPMYEISDQFYAADVSVGWSAMGCSMQRELDLIVLDSNYTKVHIEAEKDEYDANDFYFDNFGACDSTGENDACFQYSSTYTFINSDSAGTYYDLHVATKGTRFDLNEKQKAVPYDRERIYRYKNNQYVLISDITKE